MIICRGPSRQPSHNRVYIQLSLGNGPIENAAPDTPPHGHRHTNPHQSGGNNRMPNSPYASSGSQGRFLIRQSCLFPAGQRRRAPHRSHPSSTPVAQQFQLKSPRAFSAETDAKSTPEIFAPERVRRVMNSPGLLLSHRPPNRI